MTRGETRSDYIAPSERLKSDQTYIAARIPLLLYMQNRLLTVLDMSHKGIAYGLYRVRMSKLKLFLKRVRLL